MDQRSFRTGQIVDRVRYPPPPWFADHDTAHGRIHVSAAKDDPNNDGSYPGTHHAVPPHRLYRYVRQLRFRSCAVLVCQQPAFDLAAVFDQPAKTSPEQGRKR